MLRLLLRPNALIWCRQRYRHGREQGASRSWSLLLTLLSLLAWSLFPLERPGWQWLRRHRTALFPQLARPSSGDPLRALIQLCWLLLRRPVPRPLRWPMAWQRAWQVFTGALGRYLARFERKGVSA
ncbi:MAG: UDP-forming cellulose synthase catalytic subunit, partial [Aeromonas veronii]